ncbi:MAG: hypothetical protein HYY17_10665 [Planctomycetes bacterium]|nr:hypothetical protein [Planctomycetota bacterium]
MELLRRIAGYVRTMFGNMTAPQKVAVLTLLTLVAGAVVWGATSVSADGWVRVAGTELSREERNQVLTKLTEKNVRYQLKNEEIYVPKEIADQTVIELHGEGILSDATLWKFLDESNITASKWQQERRFQVAIQRKLERMISSIQTVQRAGVQLTRGSEAAALGFRGDEPTAAVTIELKPGKELTRANVVAIARLVANGMTGLKPHNVLIMDTLGNPYRLPQADTAAELAENRLDLERLYAEWLKSQILAIHPHAMVGLRPLLSAKTMSERSETADKPVTVKKESISENETSGTKTGQLAKKGEGAENAGDGTTPTSRDASESRSESFVPKKLIEIHTPWGVLEDLTVSVVLPVPVAEGENTGEVIRKEQANADAYKQSIMAAVGLKNPAALNVMFIPTRKPAGLPTLSFKEKMGDFLEKWGGSLILFLLALIALIIVYRLLKAALPKGVVEDIEALRRKLGEEVSIGPAPEIALAEEEIGRMKLTIREMVTKSPRGVAAIVKRWITGK